MSRQTPGSGSKGIKKIFATSLTETSAIDLEGVNTIRRDGNKTYKWVKYNNGAAVAAVAGNVVYAYALAGDAVSGGYENGEVTMDLTDGLFGAGILQAIIADGSFGWIQIRGPATMTTAALAGADGQALTMIGATTDGTLDLSALVTDAVCAFLTDATAKKIACMFPM